MVLWHGLAASLVDFQGVAPDFPLIWLSLLCLRYRSRACIAWGFSLGLFTDLAGGGLLGVNAFSLSLAGFAGSQISGVPQPDKPFAIRITLTAALSLMDALAPLLFLARDARAGLGVLLLRYGLPGFAYTLAAGLLIHAADAFFESRRRDPAR